MYILNISTAVGRFGPYMMTRAQAIALRDAPDELIPDMKEDASPEVETYVEGVERRLTAA